MNNEDKIIDLLTTLTSDMYIVKASVSKLEAGQAKLEDKIEKLETKVEKLETKVDNVMAIAQATHDNFALFENNYKLDRGALFDKQDVLETKLDTVAEDVSTIRERVDADELYIRVFNKKLNKA